MTPESREKLRRQLIAHESLEQRPYFDCCGKSRFQCRCATRGRLTIGVGRELDNVGLTRDECLYLLDNDLIGREQQLRARYAWFSGLDDVRQRAIIDLSFMGLNRLQGFRMMIAALAMREFERAAVELLQSKYAEQVGDRALRLAEMIRTGKDVFHA
jgi:lysozyme